MRLYITSFILSLSIVALGQDKNQCVVLLTDETQAIDTNYVYEIVEDQPQFIGGVVAMLEYLKENKEYPQEALENNTQGKAYIAFIIERDGTVSNVKNGAPLNRITDQLLLEEAIRVVKSMPKWKPGRQRGKAVRVKYTVPINFKIR